MRTVIAALVAGCVGLASMACAHAAPPEGPAAAVVAEPGALDLNQASESDLIALPHIGPAKAAAIVAYRKKHGAFTRVDDLRRVRGFGRKTIASLRSMLTVSRPPPPAGAAEAPAAR
jgi:competence protein ComEA